MVRLALLFVLAAVLCAAAPASANPLTQGVAGTATGTVQQATSTVDSVATGASAELSTSADSAVGSVAGTANAATQSAAESVDAASAPASAASAAAASASADVTSAPAALTSAAATPSSSTRAPDPSPGALSSTRDRGPARALRAGRDRADAPPPAAARQATHPLAADASSAAADPSPAAADAPPAAGVERGSARPEHDRHAPSFVPASGSASAAAGPFFAGAALLAGVFCLGGPRLVRRLLTVPAECRPATFALSLERPG